MKVISLSALLLCSCFLGACGSDSSDTANSPQNQEVQEPLEGEYKAFLRPINSDVSGFIPSGAAEITVTEGEIRVKTYLDDASGVQHLQGIFSGGPCPRMIHDQNGDGFLDIRESMAIVGKAVVPLDGDLSAQAIGSETYPSGSAFSYERSTQLDLMLADLYGSEETEFTSKLTSGSPFNLSNRVVLILGTADLARVPETVATLEGFPRNLTIPVACGVLRRAD